MQVLLIQWISAVVATMDTILIAGRRLQSMEQFMVIHVIIHQSTLAGMAYTTHRQQTCGLLTAFSMAPSPTHQFQSSRFVFILGRCNFDATDHALFKCLQLVKHKEYLWYIDIVLLDFWDSAQAQVSCISINLRINLILQLSHQFY